MIYYPLSTLMLAGIRDILIISTPQDSAAFRAPARRRLAMGLASFRYAEQPRPEGLAQAFIIGADFVAGEHLGAHPRRQHLLRPRHFRSICPRPRASRTGASVFAYQVQDPERYGVVEFDAAGPSRSRSRRSRPQPKS